MKKSTKVTINSSYIPYFGDICIKVVDQKGNQKGKSKTFKNNGRWPLFQFLTTCLKGDYKIAEDMRPRFINLFHAGNVGERIPDISDAGGSPLIQDYANSDTRRTLITYSYVETNLPNVDNTHELGSASIIYKFTIPFTHINTIDAINMICLYDTSNYNNYTNPSAFFFIKGDEGKLGSLLDQNTTNKNYNLLIEWKLTFKNTDKGE